ncbi:unnamed protein product, partial [Mesorhabditis belari]|uniref:Uncharacterized protein n=1 Tax=Mesorhabditis belari TaxID=2138241 RepID=A0AAF3FIB7_9BILA
MRGEVNPNEELDVYICIHTYKDTITLCSRTTKLSLNRRDCAIDIKLGLWVALKIDEDTQKPSFISPVGPPLETSLDNNGELIIHCRAALCETDAYQYSVPEKFVWSPEFDFIYDDNDRMTEDRGVRPNYLYTIQIKPMENAMLMSGYSKAIAIFEVVEIVGDAEGQIDIVKAPWISRSAHLPNLTATALSKREDLSKVNQNTFYKGIVCQSRTLGERSEVYVWSRNTGRFKISAQLLSRVTLQVGDWVKFQLKISHPREGPEAQRVHTLHAEEPRETSSETDNRGTTRALMLVRVVLTDAKSHDAEDEEIGTVGIKGLCAALRDKAYDIDDLIQNRNVVKFWAKFQMRDPVRHWEFRDLGDDPIEEPDETPAALPKGDLINF